ncbi:MAG TPA: 30S ribosomal protein S6 [Polyangiaceae bacterium]
MATQETVAARVREYETIYVLRPDVTKENAERIGTRVDEAVTREGGKLTLVETWGRRSLAYPVTKYKRGVYVYLKYVGAGAAVNELERNLRMLDDVLKYQTVKVRDEVDVAAIAINPEDVKFEAIEPPAEEEEEESIERALGLEDAPDRPSHHHREGGGDGFPADPADIDDDAVPDLGNVTGDDE